MRDPTADFEEHNDEDNETSSKHRGPQMRGRSARHKQQRATGQGNNVRTAPDMCHALVAGRSNQMEDESIPQRLELKRIAELVRMEPTEGKRKKKFVVDGIHSSSSMSAGGAVTNREEPLEELSCVATCTEKAPIQTKSLTPMLLFSRLLKRLGPLISNTNPSFTPCPAPPPGRAYSRGGFTLPIGQAH